MDTIMNKKLAFKLGLSIILVSGCLTVMAQKKAKKRAGNSALFSGPSGSSSLADRGNFELPKKMTRTKGENSD